jgi:hypothetical protein
MKSGNSLTSRKTFILIYKFVFKFCKMQLKIQAYIPIEHFNVMFSSTKLHKQKLFMDLFSSFEQEKWCMLYAIL